MAIPPTPGALEEGKAQGGRDAGQERRCGKWRKGCQGQSLQSSRFEAAWGEKVVLSFSANVAFFMTARGQADWKDGFKKKQAGVSDMTLLSTISNESINDNLKKRFENKEIYVCSFLWSQSNLGECAGDGWHERLIPRFAKRGVTMLSLSRAPSPGRTSAVDSASPRVLDLDG